MESGGITLDKLLSDSKFNVISTHSKTHFNLQLCIKHKFVGSMFEGKEDGFSFGCLELGMPIEYFSADAQQTDGNEALERVLTWIRLGSTSI